MQSTRLAAFRRAWVPPATALVVGCVVSLLLPVGVGVIIATVIPIVGIAVVLGLLLTLALRRRRLGRVLEVILFTAVWVASSLLVIVLARLALYATGVSVSREPFLQRLFLDVLAAAPLNLLLVAVMTGRRSSSHSDPSNAN